MPPDTDTIVAGVEAAYADACSAADPDRLSALFGSTQTPEALTNTPVLSRRIAADVIVSHGTATISTV